MIHEHNIREHLAALLRHKLSLAEFERWLGTESWNMFADSSHEAIALVAAINLLVSELHDDIIGDEEFRDGLLSLLNNVSESLSFGRDGVQVVPPPPKRLSASPAYWVVRPNLIVA